MDPPPGRLGTGEMEEVRQRKGGRGDAACATPRQGGELSRYKPHARAHLGEYPAGENVPVAAGGLQIVLDEAEQQRVSDVGQFCPALRAWSGDVYARLRIGRDVARGEPFPGGGKRRHAFLAPVDAPESIEV